ncbi:hypothetical protein [Thalassotalea sp. PLHSN55]|uniref:hypothetical protein n=1 Tax=Thalassotalea sp. PLHSN55 TaxID=3435888 RepID=UPI003F866AA4
MVSRAEQPFHRQITGSFIWAFFAFFMVVAALAALMYLQEKQNYFLQYQQLPEIEKTQQLQSVLRSAQTNIDTIFAEENAQQFPQLHQQLDKAFRQLRYSQYKSVVLPRENFYPSGSVEVNLSRLARNSALNLKLKEQGLEQLAPLLSAFRIEIIDKEVKQNQLYGQIANDRANDRVTANRARAYALLTNELGKFHQLNDLLMEINQEFNALNIHTPLAQFELLTHQIASAYTLYQQLEQASLISNDEVKNQFLQLDLLLFTEQRALSKWRGHLRIAEPYLSALVIQQSQISRALTQPNTVSVSTLSEPENLLIAWLAKYNLVINQQQLMLMLLAVAALFAVILLLVLSGIRRKVKANGHDSVMLCKQLQTEPDKEFKQFLSFEHSQIAKLVNKIHKPEHSENDYQQLLSQRQIENELLAKTGKVAFWSNAQNQQQRQLLVSLLFNKKERKQLAVNQRWQTWFDKKTFKLLIATANKAKSSGEMQSVCVASRAKKSLVITVSHQNGHYFGTVQNTSQTTKLTQQLAQVSQEKKTQEQVFFNMHYQQASHVEKSAIITSLQNQTVLVDAAIPSLKVHRRLMKLLTKNQQNKTLSRLKITEHSLQLSDFNFRDKLHVAVFNAMQTANSQKNKLLLNCDQQISHYVRLDADLFVELLSSISQNLLLEQFNATLLINCQLADKNSGQQTVRIKAEVVTEKPLKQAPELLTAFTKQSNINNNDSNLSFSEYIQALFNAMHVTNVHTDVSETGYFLTIDLPVATVQSLPASSNGAADELTDVNLQQTNILILGNEAHSQQILNDILVDVGAEVSCLTEFEQFVAATQNENSKPFAAIVLLADLYLSHFKAISAHIDSLPKVEQPKLMVMQPFFHAPFSRHGLFSQANMPICADHFIAELHTLLQGEQRDNCLIARDAFDSFRPSVAPSEVLLAIASPERQQTLIRLLQWLGLQVTLANDAQSSITQWQTGRYLILITEFEQSPLVKLATGQSINRGVFNLNEQQHTLINEEESAIAQRWQLAQFPAIDNVNDIISLLKPWLTFAKDKSIDQSSAKQAVPTPSVATQHLPIQHAPAQNVSVQSATQQAKSEQELSSFYDDEDFELDGELFTEFLIDDVEAIDLDASFDLELYAMNQGSAEIAAFMLSTYVEELEQFADNLQTAVVEKHQQDISKWLQELTVVAKVMAAPDLISTCQQLKEHISHENGEIDSDMLEQLQQQIAAVSAYAEAI